MLHARPACQGHAPTRHARRTCGRIYRWMPETLPETPRSFAPTGADIGSAALRVELDTERKLRTRNKLHYRFNHWPIWIFVFFIAPGPMTFDLFDRGRRCADGGLARGRAARNRNRRAVRQAAGCEPAPYIIRFTEDRPNPLYRRICYTTAWGESSRLPCSTLPALPTPSSRASGGSGRCTTMATFRSRGRSGAPPCVDCTMNTSAPRIDSW